MTPKQSLLKPDVDIVVQGTDRIRLDSWSVSIFANNKKVEALKVFNVDIQEYYEDHYSEIRTIDVMMGLGQYTNILYPGKEDIVVNLKRMGSDYGVSEDGEIQGLLEDNFYVGTMLDVGNEIIQSNNREILDTVALDLSKVIIVRLQLQNKAEEQIRLLQVGGNYRNKTVGDVLLAVITDAVKQIETDAELIPNGVVLTPPHNEKIYEQIIIPDGTLLVDLPGYIQEFYGIYTTGISHYIRNGTWNIFPTYDFQNTDTLRSSLQISLVPKLQFPFLARTYRKMGSSSLIIAGSDKRLVETSVAKFANEGNGAKYVLTKELLNDQTKDPNTSFRDASKIVSNFVAYEKPNGVNNIPLSDRSITNNPFKVQSSLTSRAGSYLSVVWDFSDPDIAVPGAIATIRYEDNGEIKEFKGVLVGAVHGAKLYGGGFTSHQYWTQSALHFFVDRNVDMVEYQNDTTG